MSVVSWAESYENPKGLTLTSEANRGIRSHDKVNAAAASKKKGHTSWKAHDQSKRQTSEKMSDFQGHLREGRGSSQFTPLQGRQKRFLRPRWEKPQPLAKRKVTHHEEHKTSQSGTLQRRGLTSEVSQGKRRGLTDLLPLQEHQKKFSRPRGSSTEVLHEHCFNRLRLKVKNQMVPATTSLTGFSGETIWPLGQLWLLVTIGDADHSTRAWMNFMIVRSLSPYNGIIGRPGIKEIYAVPSTAHGVLKFPIDGGIVTIRSTILIPTEYTTVITSSKEIPKEAGVCHENFKEALHPNFLDQEVAIGGTLSAKERTELSAAASPRMEAVVAIIISSMVFGTCSLRRFVNLRLLTPCMNPNIRMHSRAPFIRSVSTLNRSMKSSMVSPSLYLMLWIFTGSLTYFFCCMKYAKKAALRSLYPFMLSRGSSSNHTLAAPIKVELNI
nr:reverse transcriptase domain-containing protein [Tanacetum cinerariifolium]